MELGNGNQVKVRWLYMEKFLNLILGYLVPILERVRT